MGMGRDRAAAGKKWVPEAATRSPLLLLLIPQGSGPRLQGSRALAPGHGQRPLTLLASHLVALAQR